MYYTTPSIHGVFWPIILGYNHRTLRQFSSWVLQLYSVLSLRLGYVVNPLAKPTDPSSIGSNRWSIEILR
jgi:hypothetical protein